MHHASRHRSAGTAVKFGLLVTVILVVTEFVAGYLSSSLALTSDGWHNLTDVPTLLLSWIALRLEQRPPDQGKTFGYQRAGVLAAFVNALRSAGVDVILV